MTRTFHMNIDDYVTVVMEACELAFGEPRTPNQEGTWVAGGGGGNGKILITFYDIEQAETFHSMFSHVVEESSDNIDPFDWVSKS